jgi:putative Mg2+ transporter-C (MgtC) family protein
MDAMPLHPQWSDLLIRLIVAVCAGAVIGLNRTERGRPAGLRTTILVCLAAAIAMIQANLLLATTGKTPDSFSIADVLRYPLGILSGIGFIGAGVILRRGDLVTGVTTAATMWMVTVLGLAIGGGQLLLGSAGAILTVIVLWLLPFLERLMPRDRSATLSIELTGDLAGEPAGEGALKVDVPATLAAGGYRAVRRSATYGGEEGSVSHVYEVRWRSARLEPQEPAFVGELAHQAGVRRVSWATHNQTGA